MWDSPRHLNLAALLVAGIALAAFAAGAAAWFARQPAFALRSIRVEPIFGSGAGASGSEPFRHVNVTTIRSEAIPRILSSTRNNFFTVDLEAVRHAFEGVAWVRRAQVRREWPRSLIVAIEEQQVLGTWDDGRLVNTFGELFTANPAEAEEDSTTPLPELSGPAGSEHDVAARYVDFKAWFARLGLQPDQVTLSPRYAWSLHVDNGTTDGLAIEIGRERDANTVPERVLRVLNAWPVLTSRWPRPTLIDLRYPNGFALRAEGLRIADPAAKPVARSPARPPAAKANTKPKTKEAR